MAGWKGIESRSQAHTLTLHAEIRMLKDTVALSAEDKARVQGHLAEEQAKSLALESKVIDAEQAKMVIEQQFNQFAGSEQERSETRKQMFVLMEGESSLRAEITSLQEKLSESSFEIEQYTVEQAKMSVTLEGLETQLQDQQVFAIDREKVLQQQLDEEREVVLKIEVELNKSQASCEYMTGRLEEQRIKCDDLTAQLSEALRQVTLLTSDKEQKSIKYELSIQESQNQLLQKMGLPKHIA